MPEGQPAPAEAAAGRKAAQAEGSKMPQTGSVNKPTESTQSSSASSALPKGYDNDWWKTFGAPVQESKPSLPASTETPTSSPFNFPRNEEQTPPSIPYVITTVPLQGEVTSSAPLNQETPPPIRGGAVDDFDDIFADVEAAPPSTTPTNPNQPALPGNAIMPTTGITPFPEPPPTIEPPPVAPPLTPKKPNKFLGGIFSPLSKINNALQNAAEGQVIKWEQAAHNQGATAHQDHDDTPHREHRTGPLDVAEKAEFEALKRELNYQGGSEREDLELLRGVWEKKMGREKIKVGANSPEEDERPENPKEPEENIPIVTRAEIHPDEDVLSTARRLATDADGRTPDLYKYHRILAKTFAERSDEMFRAAKAAGQDRDAHVIQGLQGRMNDPGAPDGEIRYDPERINIKDNLVIEMLENSLKYFPK